jgi:hypothetical protein
MNGCLSPLSGTDRLFSQSSRQLPVIGFAVVLACMVSLSTGRLVDPSPQTRVGTLPLGWNLGIWPLQQGTAIDRR